MTATSSLQQLVETPVVERLRNDSFNRAVAHIDHQEALSYHHGTRTEFLEDLIEELRDVSVQDVLAELRGVGLLWSVVAEVVGVTDAAIRKWRRGDSIDATHRQRLARLAAFGRLYAAYAVPPSATGFAEWLDSRIVTRFSATPLQLMVLNRNSDTREFQPLLDWMLDHSDREHGEVLLDRYLGSGWRDDAKEEQRFRIVTNSDGERILLVD